MFQFAIRGDGGDFLAVSVLGRSHPGATDYWDGNGVPATVEVTAGGFRGSAAGAVRADELVRFHGQLVRLQDSLQGTAEFETMERWLLALGCVGAGGRRARQVVVIGQSIVTLVAATMAGMLGWIVSGSRAAAAGTAGRNGNTS